MLPIFAIMVIMLVVISGAAFDVSRTVNAREKLSYAIDAAALSVAADLSTSVMTDDEITEAIADSFRANLNDAEFLEDAIDNLDFTVDSENGTIVVSSSAMLNTYFIDFGGYGMKALGPEVLSFGASSQVTYSRFDVELALVLDVTGSMRNDMDTLRDAADGLVDILIPEGTDEADSKVRISLVPYSQGVNLGPYADLVKGGDYGHSDGSYCVTERQNYDDGSDTYEVKYTDLPYNYYDETDPPPKATFYGDGESNNCSSDSEMIPLTSDRDTLVDAIAALDDNGGTAGQTGVVWGWNSLSPNYSDVWPADSAPEAYDNDDVLKFAIIMTDGDNNQHYDFVETEWRRTCSGPWWNRTCSWNEVEVNDWEENYEAPSYSNTPSTDQRALCEAMKDAGIEIFGVYFGSSNSSAGSLNMQSCASDGNYYQATSASELINAFSNIAKKIQQIYVSR
ncbi:pilus assembly protein TadG-related protein [Roseibium sediminicola]|uniref:Pilus assembly protein TadG-related protein n=1 Tax=Roseibium sediminicola TaxID=2933272 RepID=A0ABT0GYR2_9HYPH|nr:pilus assembly protein TadG-related protein [Roseibium sp. CAU 1639]